MFLSTLKEASVNYAPLNIHAPKSVILINGVLS